MSGLNFEDEDQIVPTRSGRSKTAPKKDEGEKEKPEERRRKGPPNRMPLWIGLGVGGVLIVVAAIVIVAFGVGVGPRSDSYTDKALAAYQNGYAADFYRKGNTPSAKQIAAVEKKLKKVKAGTVADFRQGLRILNVHRDLDEYQLDTLGTSEYLRSTFFSVFGQPSDTPAKAPFPQMKTWHHRCSDGSVEMLGVMQIEGNPQYMKLLPPKKHGNS
ncbi:MAG TPA: hypothetical protein VHR72_15010 [Gemmataceae bacterium]|jgi:hypothetical protein|nr:hypothetical protein [Gemmataceae bacterium]